MSWTYGTKATSTYTDQTKNSATWDYEIRGGKTYFMGDFNMGSEFDKTGDPIYLGQIGIGQSYDYLTKH